MTTSTDALYQLEAPHVLSVDEKQVLYEATCILEKLVRLNPVEVCSPQTVADYLTHLVASEEQELFFALWLDTRHRLITTEKLFVGTLDCCSVYPREVVKSALAANAAAVVFAHNHPSGDAEPSRADIDITRRLNEALKLVSVRTLDHFVVAKGRGHTSLAERNLL